MMVHLGGLPPDSATSRKQKNAPMGWDNTTEMTATVVDAVNRLTRLFYNANFENPIDPLPLMPRPYEAAREPVKPETITLAAFGDLLAEGN